MDSIINRREAGALVLPNGQEVRAGEAVAIAADEWASIAKHPVVAAWLAAGDITHKPDPAAVVVKATTKAPAPVKAATKGATANAGTPPPDPGSADNVDPLS